MDDVEREFQRIIDSMAEDGHGSRSWQTVCPFLEDRFRKTAKMYDFVAPKLVRDVIYWEDLKDKVWPGDPAAQDDNRFYLLQGDIIETSLVPTLVDKDGNQLGCIFGPQRVNDGHWLVLSTDCDTARAPFVRVAPIFAVKTKTAEFVNAVKLSSAKMFPIPRLVGDHADIIGRYADIAATFMLDARHGQAALPRRLCSFTTVGWHLLNAQLIHLVSRADKMEEALQLRSFPPVSPGT